MFDLKKYHKSFKIMMHSDQHENSPKLFAPISMFVGRQLILSSAAANVASHYGFFENSH